MGEPHIKRFTDAFLRGLKLPGVQRIRGRLTAAGRPYKLSEWAPKGEGRLTVRVQPGGSKELFYRYRAHGGDTLIFLGRYDPEGRRGKTLAEIRNGNPALRKKPDAADVDVVAAKGVDGLKAIMRNRQDPKLELEKQRREKLLRLHQGSFADLCGAYVGHLRKKGKAATARQVEGIFRLHIIKPFPEFAGKPAHQVDGDDLEIILRRMAVGQKLTRQVNKARAYLHAAFEHGRKANIEDASAAGLGFGLKGRPNPVADIHKIARFERAGDRALTEDELRAFWLALDALPLVQRSTLRLNLALACQRPTQLLRADWPAFDFEQETLLLRDSKGRGGARDHLLPLSALALEQLKPLRELNSEASGPFVADGRRTMALETLSKAVREISDTLKREKGIPRFQLRDLRRTCETMLQKIGVEKELRAHLLSHGRSQGVQGKHYERYDFLPEKRAALEAWARHLERVLDPKRAAKVVPIKGRAA